MRSLSGSLAPMRRVACGGSARNAVVGVAIAAASPADPPGADTDRLYAAFTRPGRRRHGAFTRATPTTVRRFTAGKTATMFDILLLLLGAGCILLMDGYAFLCARI